MKTLIENKDYEGIKQLLDNNPNLANEGITIPYDSSCITKAHPLHRICDAVFAKKITDEKAIEIAKILLDFGANIDGDKTKENQDTPLLAAASLHAEKLGIFYIDKGTDIHYAGGHDGATALHWAAYSASAGVPSFSESPTPPLVGAEAWSPDQPKKIIDVFIYSQFADDYC